MASNKAADSEDVTLEMIKYGSQRLHGTILSQYNKMLQDASFDISWYTTVFHMIPKAGNLSDTSNWRPV
eukprot:7841618-Karenia_brevis.AAC.1